MIRMNFGAPVQAPPALDTCCSGGGKPCDHLFVISKPSISDYLAAQALLGHGSLTVDCLCLWAPALCIHELHFMISI